MPARYYSLAPPLVPGVRAGEGTTTLLLFVSVFLVLCAYYFMKSLREGWLASYAAMALIPVLLVIKVMKIAENSTDYSIAMCCGFRPRAR